jgi:hypothetical protein
MFSEKVLNLYKMHFAQYSELWDMINCWDDEIKKVEL